MELNRQVKGALNSLESGWFVFPLKPNAKTPAFTGWQEWAREATKEKVMAFYERKPHSNWGIFCEPSDLTVIDVDTKQDGYDSLSILETKNGDMPSTFKVRTPSGGLHIYCKGALRSTVSTLGKGIDTRGNGGYVVAPGSKVATGQSYDVIETGDIADTPSWIKAILEAKKEVATIQHRIEAGERNTLLTSIAGTMRRRGVEYEGIYSALQGINEHQLEEPISNEELKIIADSVSKYDPQDALAVADFLEMPQIQAMKASDIVPNEIKKRDWVMSERYLGGFITVTIAPGGVGKSNFTMLDAISIATGKELTGYKVNKRGGVWVYNTEDPVDELQRRFLAISLHHNIRLSELNNVHFTSGREMPLVMAKRNKDGVAINQLAIDTAVNYIKEHDIKLFIVDPFVRSHEVNENDNMEIDKVVQCFNRIADRTGCAIGLVHHTSKGIAKPGEMDKARGASALVSACRIAHTVSPMTAKEANEFGIKEDGRFWYMRLDNAKANLSAPTNKTKWYKKISVDILNGDSVGTLELVRKDLMGIKEERKYQKEKLARIELGRLLFRLMRVGDTLAVKSVVDQIIYDELLSATFELDESNQARSTKQLLKIGRKESLIHNGVEFMVLDKGENVRPRYHFKANNVPNFLL